MNTNVPVAVRPLLDEGPNNDGVDEVMWGLQREVAPVQVVLDIAVDGDPKSKARPRLGKNGRTYTPQATQDAEQRLAVLVRNALRGHRPEPVPASFGVLAVFFTENRQRRDVDNMLKLVMDAVTMSGKQYGFGVWDDDSQVSEVSARLVRADEHPRTHLRVYRTLTESAPMGTCELCGAAFRVYPSQRGRYCSRACRDAARRAPRLTGACRTCYKELTFTAAQPKVYCDESCQYADPNRRSGRRKAGLVDVTVGPPDT